MKHSKCNQIDDNCFIPALKEAILCSNRLRQLPENERNPDLVHNVEEQARYAYALQNTALRNDYIKALNLSTAPTTSTRIVWDTPPAKPQPAPAKNRLGLFLPKPA